MKRREFITLLGGGVAGGGAGAAAGDAAHRISRRGLLLRRVRTLMALRVVSLRCRSLGRNPWRTDGKHAIGGRGLIGIRSECATRVLPAPPIPLTVRGGLR
jgi:hypothetical protein